MPDRLHGKGGTPTAERALFSVSATQLLHREHLPQHLFCLPMDEHEPSTEPGSDSEKPQTPTDAVAIPRETPSRRARIPEQEWLEADRLQADPWGTKHWCSPLKRKNPCTKRSGDGAKPKSPGKSASIQKRARCKRPIWISERDWLEAGPSGTQQRYSPSKSETADGAFDEAYIELPCLVVLPPDDNTENGSIGGQLPMSSNVQDAFPSTSGEDMVILMVTDMKAPDANCNAELNTTNLQDGDKAVDNENPENGSTGGQLPMSSNVQEAFPSASGEDMVFLMVTDMKAPDANCNAELNTTNHQDGDKAVDNVHTDMTDYASPLSQPLMSNGSVDGAMSSTSHVVMQDAPDLPGNYVGIPGRSNDFPLNTADNTIATTSSASGHLYQVQSGCSYFSVPMDNTVAFHTVPSESREDAIQGPGISGSYARTSGTTSNLYWNMDYHEADGPFSSCAQLTFPSAGGVQS
ncbi:hypothetical protein MTO96_021930 [Rhipicephalus appendiculatus]